MYVYMYECKYVCMCKIKIMIASNKRKSVLWPEFNFSNKYVCTIYMESFQSVYFFVKRKKTDEKDKETALLRKLAEQPRWWNIEKKEE